jgi:TorA maturation chaperone TorD
LFLYPDEPVIEAVLDIASHLGKLKHVASEYAFYPEWLTLLKHAEALAPARSWELQDTYSSLFAPGIVNGPVPLFESGYMTLDPVDIGQLIGELEQDYANAGLAISSDSTQGPDHISVELTFLAYLCDRESDALETGNHQAVIEAMETEWSFTTRHPARWTQLLWKAIASRDSESVYAAGARAAWAMVVHDERLLPALKGWLTSTHLEVEARAENARYVSVS